METTTFPKAWEGVLGSASFIPVTSVKAIERYHDAEWSKGLSMHETFEMVYIKSGSGVFEIGEQNVSVGSNDIVIIKPNQRHKLSVASEDGCDFIVLYFKFMDQTEHTLSEVSLGDFINFVSGRESGSFIKLKVSQKNDIIVLLNRILKEQTNDQLGSELLNYLMLMELFVLISRALKAEWENSIKNKSPKIKELMQSAIQFVHNNFEREISITDIAKYVFLSPSYFTRAFKENTGLSPMQYLLNIRIKRACELLQETDQKVGEIALSVGFSNQQRFNDMFKKQTNMTPMQYRNSSKNIHN
ncbi:transcriptional regulator, AraC family [Ruminiclostridium papyrosolvens DSM 2782]|uniref:Transcriptional regulator, AraC family n=1 Tax=Ruminiclostridium papyrosolvens DSM 2782 TaxID=588581 RepID=F1TCS6_9FIRM|nr:AraC family transcriptional regulator [Ruminiclostridium papyrosolvens]EGD47793.1 transcriptional regulator, AraC family [Ruminiclostridium papyrosolvens DSM 2782]WES34510.1 AraC family transcriptional regulator [Ruminiclostridium papyrosolvens DSM 2782]